MKMKVIINGVEYELEEVDYKYFIDYLKNNKSTIEEIENKIKQIIKESKIQ